jgi:hypothetical protein
MTDANTDAKMTDTDAKMTDTDAETTDTNTESKMTDMKQPTSKRDKRRVEATEKFIKYYKLENHDVPVDGMTELEKTYADYTRSWYSFCGGHYVAPSEEQKAEDKKNEEKIQRLKDEEGLCESDDESDEDDDDNMIDTEHDTYSYLDMITTNIFRMAGLVGLDHPDIIKNLNTLYGILSVAKMRLYSDPKLIRDFKNNDEQDKFFEDLFARCNGLVPLICHYSIYAQPPDPNNWYYVGNYSVIAHYSKKYLMKKHSGDVGYDGEFSIPFDEYFRKVMSVCFM